MKRIIYYLTLLSLSGCSYFAIRENITGNYYLVAGDEEEQCSLSYLRNPNDNYDPIVGASVYAVGNNETYMLVKQHPRTFPYPSDKSLTYYYILPIKKEIKGCVSDGLLGPYTAEQFNVKRKELSIPDSVSFTRVLKDLE